MLAVIVLGAVVMTCGLLALFGVAFAGDGFFYGGGFLLAYVLIYAVTAAARWRRPLSVAILLLWFVAVLLNLAGYPIIPLYEGNRFGLGFVLGTLFAALQRLLTTLPFRPLPRWQSVSRGSLPLSILWIVCSALALVLAAAVVLIAYLAGRSG